MKPSESDLKTVADRMQFYMDDLNLPKKRIARIMGMDEMEFDERMSSDSFVVQIRKANGYNQEEFAEIMGIARTTQSAIERNQQTITIGYMRRLHQIFKVPYHAIIDQKNADINTIEEMSKLEEKIDKYKKMLEKLGVNQNLL